MLIIQLFGKVGLTIDGAGITSHFREEGNDLYNAAIDALESIVLAHQQAGVTVTTNEYCRGLEDALVAIENHFGHVDPDKCAHHWAVNEETDRTYCLYCGTDGDG